MSPDRRTAAIEQAAKAWAEHYLWAMEQPQKNYRYRGGVADDILAAGGISFRRDRADYLRACDEVIALGYQLAGGKVDRRGVRDPEMRRKLKRAKAMRARKMTYRAIAEKLGVSITTVYRAIGRAA